MWKSLMRRKVSPESPQGKAGLAVGWSTSKAFEATSFGKGRLLESTATYFSPWAVTLPGTNLADKTCTLLERPGTTVPPSARARVSYLRQYGLRPLRRRRPNQGRKIPLPFVVHPHVAELFALRIGSVRGDSAGFAIGRHDNSTGDSNLFMFLNG